jgi:hypothetical protein
MSTIVGAILFHVFLEGRAQIIVQAALDGVRIRLKLSAPTWSIAWAIGAKAEATRTRLS